MFLDHHPDTRNRSTRRPIYLLPVPISFISVHEEPFHTSVSVLLGSPPKARAKSVDPHPPNPYLAVFKSPTSVQLVPSHFSTVAVAGGVKPPKARASVLDDPDLPDIYFAVFKSATSVQLVPSHDSVIA